MSPGVAAGTHGTRKGSSSCTESWDAGRRRLELLLYLAQPARATTEQWSCELLVPHLDLSLVRPMDKKLRSSLMEINRAVNSLLLPFSLQ